MAFNHLLRHDALSRNTLWNIVSQIVPSIVALVAIPLLLKGLGQERFGLLTICWMITGYFSLLDFGVGRALTQLIASRVQTSDEQSISKIIQSSLLVTLVISIILTLILLLVKDYLIFSVLNVPKELHRETHLAVILLTLSIPLMILSSSLKGVLESIQRFDLVNIVRAPATALSFVLPVITLSFSNELHWSLASLLFFRVLTVVFYWFFCVRIFPSIGRLKGLSNLMHWQTIKPLIHFGGWMTVSNVISPIMVQMDRVFIGNILTISAVAFYTTPYEMVSKLLILPGAVSGVLFPAFATMKSTQNSQKTTELLDVGVRTITLFVMPIVFLIVLFAPEGLSLWLGPEMASHCITVTQILAFGFLFVSIAHAPFALLQAAGRPDITAKIHVFELIVYVPILILLTHKMGIEGAALAWFIRATLDFILLTILSKKMMNTSIQYLFKELALLLATSTALYLSVPFLSLITKVIVAIIICGLSLLVFKSLSKKQKILSF